jgi:DNA polymerase I-like protein with 3'-5' exonuclease and polymerase domains/5'-3' exonuclease
MKIALNKAYHILDFRGLVLKSYWLAKKTVKEGDETFPEWKDGLLNFIELVVDPLLESTPPRKIIAVKDGGNNYRSALYPNYKRKRREEAKKSAEAYPKRKEHIDTLMKEAENFLLYLGVKFVSVDGQEADDVIALLCRSLKEHAKTVHTVDADLLQLADSLTWVQMWNETYSRGDEYQGVPTNLIALHKSLVGDSSDEYPGVRGFGPAKWSSLEKDFGRDGLEQLEASVASGDFSVVERAYKASGHPALKLIVEDLRSWSICYALAKLHPEVCYGNKDGAPLLPKWAVRIPNKDKVSQCLIRAKAPDLIGKYDNILPSFEVIDAGKTDRLVSVVEGIVRNSDVVAFDFESYDTLNHPDYKNASKTGKYVDVLNQKITGVSFCCGDNLQHNYYVSFDHADTANLGKDWLEWLLKSLYAGRNLPVVHNAAFEMSVTKTDVGIELPAPFDTQIMQSYVDENEESNLKDLTLSRFRYRQTTYEEVTEGKAMNELSAEHVLSYGCDDSLVTAFHFDLQYLIMLMEGSWEFYFENEVVHVLDAVDTFIEGTDIDFDYLKELEEEDRGIISSKTSDIRKALEAHCQVKSQEQRTEDAKRLLDLWWELESAKLADAGASSEEVEAKYAALWKKAWDAAVYVPYTEQTIAQEFIPTKTKINNIFTLLDSELRVEKVSKSYLSEWLVVNEDIIESSPEETRTFVRLMAEASHQFPSKKRSGEEYERLKAYAEKLMSKHTDNAKVISDGDELNFGSAPQMVEFLYGKLGLPCRVRSKVGKGSARDKLGLRGAPATGNKASAAAIVYDLQDENDWRRQVVLDYMDIVKAQQNVSLYYKPYPLWKSPLDGKIHPQIKNCGTVTRRPSGTAPNVLQVSSKDDAKIRRAYVPPSRKYAYVCLDFNGQELRITASESRDARMLEAYVGEDKKDIHSLTASSFAHIILPREGLTQFSSPMSYGAYLSGRSDETHGKAFNRVRKLAKAVNFLIIYGGGYTTLAQNLLISPELAKDMLNSTFNLYSGLLPWQQRVIEFARSHGYVETAFGNRRHLTKDLYSQDDFLRSRQERQAVNATIQGCAADILKHVLSQMRRRKMLQKYHIRALKPVYDEVAGCVLIDAIPDYIEEMKEVMEITPPGHPVPMEIEAAIGFESWGAKKEIGRPTREQVVEFINKEKEELGWK